MSGSIRIKVKKCLHCSRPIEERTGGFFTAGMPFGLGGLYFWSDGKQGFSIGSAFNKNFDVIKCPFCNTILWNNKLEVIASQLIGFGSYEPSIDEQELLDNAKHSIELSFDEYIDIAKREKDKSKIYYCRTKAWQLSNDKRRTLFDNQKRTSIPFSEIEIENLKKLLTMLSDENDYFLKAEIYRELKEFKKSSKILKCYAKDKNDIIYKTLLDLNNEQESNILKLDRDITSKRFESIK